MIKPTALLLALLALVALLAGTGCATGRVSRLTAEQVRLRATIDSVTAEARQLRIALDSVQLELQRLKEIDLRKRRANIKQP